MLKLILSLVACGLAFSAHSTDLTHARAKFGPRGETVPYIEMRTMTQSTERGLVEMGAEWLRRFTQSSGYEGCANICATPTRTAFGMILATSHAQIGCALVDQRCPSGMTPVGRSIHSHPMPPSHLVLNDHDREFVRARRSGQAVRRYERMSIQRDRFSKEDLASGPGYLVTSDNIWFQERGKTVKFSN